MNRQKFIAVTAARYLVSTSTVKTPGEGRVEESAATHVTSDVADPPLGMGSGDGVRGSEGRLRGLRGS
jgi:hypothetical protein